MDWVDWDGKLDVQWFRRNFRALLTGIEFSN
jgi:hypothetical protein